MGLLVASILLAFTGVKARAEAPSEREAQAWLRLPPGSTSLGRTNDGELAGPVELSKAGRGYALLSQVRGRKTNYGTRELIDLIEEASAVVAAKFPGSVLGIGNLGFESGRKIPWSVSHQAGRDADLGMYATAMDGTPLERVARGPMPFHKFDAELTADAGGRKVRFDLARNLELVRALVAAPSSRVQYIFVAAWLKSALLAEARRVGLDATTQARLAEVLHQPSDSNPHADHYHVRLFCSIEDRTFGCVNRGPERAWVDPGDREHAAAARQVASILELPAGKRTDKLVLAAIARLERMVATSELAALVEALGDARVKIRKAALGALETLGDPRAAEGIVALLPTIRDPAWAAELFGAIPALDGEALLPLAERVLADPLALLHPDARKNAAPALLIGSIEVLAEAGSKAHVERLIALAEHRDKGVAKAAEAALRMRTCQPLKGAKAYRSFWKEGARLDELELAESGLRARKLALPTRLRSREGVDSLIALLDRRQPEVRGCAERLLGALTGHAPDVDRPPARNRKHWAHWWSENLAGSELR